MASSPVGDFHYWIYVIGKFETVSQEDKEESQNHEWKGNSRLYIQFTLQNTDEKQAVSRKKVTASQSHRWFKKRAGVSKSLKTLERTGSDPACDSYSIAG